MTHPAFAHDPDKTATPLHAVAEAECAAWLAEQTDGAREWLERLGFSGKLGQVHLVPTATGAMAVAGYGSEASRARGRFHLAAAANALPDGTYRLVTDLTKAERAETGLGWLLAGYRFTRYKGGSSATGARLVAPDDVDAARLEAIARGEVTLRDLINTPANDMGPDELEEAARAIADAHGATIEVTTGEALLTANFPLIHAVGRASPRAPRLIDLRHGTEGPSVTLVGKGVVFDTGGLNLKPSGAMGLMKKDMGGAAHVLGLAQALLATDAKIRLRVLLPVAENAVSGASFRPGDVLTARNGKTVEINNTDAEGRLVLADALSLAGEETPDLMVSMATLTGAARVAVGPDLAPFYTDDAALAAALGAAGDAVADPVWRMPFHTPYEAMIEPAIADLDNAPKGGFAGSITAALFLRRFAGGAARYVHFDVYGWQPSAAPARPAGGTGQGWRALMAAMPEVLPE